jgi:hypothetical protein
MISCIPQPPVPPTPTQMPGCVDFSGYPDDTMFGNPFNLNGYNFAGLGAEPFVNVSGSVVGLQFIDAGLETDLPGPASTVTLDVASFTQTPLILTALDSSGATVANATVPGDNAVHNITLTGNNIVKVTISGGGNEGILVRICSTQAQVVCVDFEPPVAVGTQYGSPAGHSPGTLIFTTNNIAISVFDFEFVGGGGTFNVATVEGAMSSPPFGIGQIINTNNINLEFDFSGIGFQVSQVDLGYLDLGGFENLFINGSSPYIGDLPSAPSSIAGVNLFVVTTPVTGGNTGVLTLTGIVTTLRMGGQEFWIDNVCVRE